MGTAGTFLAVAVMSSVLWESVAQCDTCVAAYVAAGCSPAYYPPDECQPCFIEAMAANANGCSSGSSANSIPSAPTSPPSDTSQDTTAIIAASVGGVVLVVLLVLLAVYLRNRRKPGRRDIEMAETKDKKPKAATMQYELKPLLEYSTKDIAAVTKAEAIRRGVMSRTDEQNLVFADQVKKRGALKARQRAQDICKTDISKYTLIFEDVRTEQANELEELEATVANMQDRLGLDSDAEENLSKLSQPTEIKGVTDTKEVEYLVHLEEAFQAHDETIFDGAKAVAAELGQPFKAGPAKNPKRIEEKATLAYDGDYSQLKDFRRASIVCDNIAEIDATIRRLEADGIKICRIKNRFHRKYDATNESAGYRDLQLSVMIPGTELIWELQIHLAAIENLKSQLRDADDGSGRTGHGRYIAFRTIVERL